MDPAPPFDQRPGIFEATRWDEDAEGLAILGIVPSSTEKRMAVTVFDESGGAIVVWLTSREARDLARQLSIRAAMLDAGDD